MRALNEHFVVQSPIRSRGPLGRHRPKPSNQRALGEPTQRSIASSRNCPGIGRRAKFLITNLFLILFLHMSAWPTQEMSFGEPTSVCATCAPPTRLRSSGESDRAVGRIAARGTLDDVTAAPKSRHCQIAQQIMILRLALPKMSSDNGPQQHSKDCCPLGHACHSTRRTTYMD